MNMNGCPDNVGAAVCFSSPPVCKPVRMKRCEINGRMGIANNLSYQLARAWSQAQAHHGMTGSHHYIGKVYQSADVGKPIR